MCRREEPRREGAIKEARRAYDDLRRTTESSSSSEEG